VDKGLSEFSVRVLEVSFACVSVRTNVDSTNVNEGVKRTKVTGVWVVTSCGLMDRYRSFGRLCRVFCARK
jgi:hypothetical protein